MPRNSPGSEKCGTRKGGLGRRRGGLHYSRELPENKLKGEALLPEEGAGGRLCSRKTEGRSKNSGLERREVGEAGSLRKLCLSRQIVELHLRFKGIREGKRLKKRRHVESKITRQQRELQDQIVVLGGESRRGKGRRRTVLHTYESPIFELDQILGGCRKGEEISKDEVGSWSREVVAERKASTQGR